jgi:hypothetical protein
MILALKGCVIVALQGCMIVTMQGCVIVALQGCMIVALHGCDIWNWLIFYPNVKYLLFNNVLWPRHSSGVILMPSTQVRCMYFNVQNQISSFHRFCMGEDWRIIIITKLIKLTNWDFKKTLKNCHVRLMRPQGFSWISDIFFIKDSEIFSLVSKVGPGLSILEKR